MHRCTDWLQALSVRCAGSATRQPCTPMASMWCLRGTGCCKLGAGVCGLATYSQLGACICVCVCAWVRASELGCMRTQMCSCGTVSLWHCVFVALCLCGTVSLWHCVFVALCLCGIVSLWHCVFVALCLCGIVSLWHCVFVALCLCGIVSLWHCVFVIHLLPFSKISAIPGQVTSGCSFAGTLHSHLLKHHTNWEYSRPYMLLPQNGRQLPPTLPPDSGLQITPES